MSSEFVASRASRIKWGFLFLVVLSIVIIVVITVFFIIARCSMRHALISSQLDLEEEDPVSG